MKAGQAPQRHHPFLLPPVSEDGVMFGSVAKSDIIKNLAAADMEIHKDMIRLAASIKAVAP